MKPPSFNFGQRFCRSGNWVGHSSDGVSLLRDVWNLTWEDSEIGDYSMAGYWLIWRLLHLHVQAGDSKAKTWLGFLTAWWPQVGPTHEMARSSKHKHPSKHVNTYITFYGPASDVTQCHPHCILLVEAGASLRRVQGSGRRLYLPTWGISKNFETVF